MSVDELVNNFNIQKKKINLFKFLKKNDKLMENSIENNLYIEHPSYFRFIKRWWYGEDKETAFKHLNNYFIEFIKFLDTILSSIKEDKSKDIIVLGNSICNYINNIIPGIHALKNTYPNYTELHNKIASIIMTLVDFKNEFRTLTKVSYNRQRSLSF